MFRRLFSKGASAYTVQTEQTTHIMLSPSSTTPSQSQSSDDTLVDCTMWLPEELFLHILRLLPIRQVYSQVALVSKRWLALTVTLSMEQAMKISIKFEKYSTKFCQPKIFSHTNWITALAIMDNGCIFAGTGESQIRVHQPSNNIHTKIRNKNKNSENTKQDDDDIDDPSPHNIDTLAVPIMRGHVGCVFDLVLSKDEKRLFSCSMDKKVMAWSTEDYSLLHEFPALHHGWVFALALSPDGRVLFSGSNDFSIRVWSLDDYSATHVIRGHKKYDNTHVTGHRGAVTALSVHSDGRLFSGSRDSTIKVWSKNDYSLMHTMAKHTGWVHAVVMLNDERFASGSNDTTVRLWSCSDYSELCVLSTDGGAVWSLAHNARDGFLFSGSANETIRVWSLKDYALKQTLPGHESYVSTLATSPNNRLLVSGSDDGTVRVW